MSPDLGGFSQPSTPDGRRPEEPLKWSLRRAYKKLLANCDHEDLELISEEALKAARMTPDEPDGDLLRGIAGVLATAASLAP